MIEMPMQVFRRSRQIYRPICLKLALMIPPQDGSAKSSLSDSKRGLRGYAASNGSRMTAFYFCLELLEWTLVAVLSC